MTVAAGFVARSASAPAVAPALPRRRALLTVVPKGEPQPRAPFAFAIVALMVTGLIGLLVLNTVLAKDAFKLHALQVEGRKLADTEQFLTREVESLRSPSALAEKASAMGMVQAGPPAFLRLPDGAVLGSAEPAQAPELVPAPQAQDAPEPVAEETSTDETSTDETSTEEETTEDG
ncbi:MAG: sle [Frankiales bacterium]|jgi:hypothetical protein|nr:sle [Frankiales bacterium]